MSINKTDACWLRQGQDHFRPLNLLCIYIRFFIGVPVLLDSRVGRMALQKDPTVSLMTSCMEWVCMKCPRDFLWNKANRHWIAEDEVNLPCQNKRKLPPSWKNLGEHEKKNDKAYSITSARQVREETAASAAKFRLSPKSSLPHGSPGCASAAPGSHRAERRYDKTSSCNSRGRVRWAGQEQGRLFRPECEGLYPVMVTCFVFVYTCALSLSLSYL